MRALNLATNKDSKRLIDQKCRSLLDNAEHIRSSRRSTADGLQFTDKSSAPSALTTKLRLKAPHSSRQLTTREQIILLEGSKLHGTVFPPWKSPPEPSEFEILEGQPKHVYVV